MILKNINKGHFGLQGIAKLLGCIPGETTKIRASTGFLMQTHFEAPFSVSSDKSYLSFRYERRDTSQRKFMP